MKSLVALAFLALLLVVLGCSSAAPSPTGTLPAGGTPTAATSAPAAAVTCLPQAVGGDASGAIVDFEFQPAAITATAGQTVTWTNNGAAPHTATLDDGPSCPDTERMSPGAQHSLTFNEPGEYAFHCAIHATMTGTVTVQP